LLSVFLLEQQLGLEDLSPPWQLLVLLILSPLVQHFLSDDLLQQLVELPVLLPVQVLLQVVLLESHFFTSVAVLLQG